MTKKSIHHLYVLLFVAFSVQAQEKVTVYDTYEDFAKNVLIEDENVYVINFWATWCAPCVQEQPELKKLYEKHKAQVDSKEFEILGISLDKSKENWQKVVEKNQINWPQIGDLKFWKSPIAKAYSINELPYNLIIDGEGKIIAKNLHGEELEAFLDSVFKK